MLQKLFTELSERQQSVWRSTTGFVPYGLKAEYPCEHLHRFGGSGQVQGALRKTPAVKESLNYMLALLKQITT